MKDTRLKIGIDLDGVVSNFIQKYREICIGICGHDLPHESSDWNQTNWNLDKEVHNKAWGIIKNTHSFYRYLEVLPGVSIVSMIRLSKAQRLFFITTRPPTEGAPIEIQSAAWLVNNFSIAYPTVIVADNKGPIAKGLGLDAFIDDKPENLLDVHEYSPETKLFVRSQAWNEKFTHPSVTRVDDFNAFVNELEPKMEQNGPCFIG
jgi:hypothetical protein